jgi:hypothetical protein
LAQLLSELSLLISDTLNGNAASGSKSLRYVPSLGSEALSLGLSGLAAGMSVISGGLSGCHGGVQSFLVEVFCTHFRLLSRDISSDDFVVRPLISPAGRDSGLLPGSELSNNNPLSCSD